MRARSPRSALPAALRRPLCLLVLLLLAACGGGGGAGGTGEEGGGGGPPPPPPPPPPPALFPLFEDVTAVAGIDAVHVDTVGDRHYGTGQAWGDYDGDGHLDLYLTSNIGRNVLYRNRGDGTFEVSPFDSVVALPEARSGGALFADYDEDGWPDLLVLNCGPNVLFHNEGGAGFTDVTALAGVGDGGKGESAAWADYDQDGDIDLYVTNWYTNSCLETEDVLARSRDRFYRNEGDGTFTDVTHLLGDAELTGLGFAVSWLDYDDDGDLDLYVVNDKGYPGEPPPGTRMNRNVLWRNDGPGAQPGDWVFTEVAVAAGADGRVNGMGIAVGDADGDGWLDLAYTDAGPVDLLRNRGDGTFADVSDAAGLVHFMSGWGIVFADLDLDGDLDLHVAADGADDRTYLNEGDGTFADRTEACGALDADDTRGLACADYDGDGWLDLVVGNTDGPYRLYRNLGGATGRDHHYLRLRLVGGAGVNRDAIGSRVWVTDTEGVVRMQEVKCGSSLGAGNDLALTFGLGPAQVASVRIRWPDGLEQVFEDVATDRTVVLSRVP